MLGMAPAMGLASLRSLAFGGSIKQNIKSAQALAFELGTIDVATGRATAFVSKMTK